MAARILNVTANATATSVKLRASVTSAVPALDVSYAYPVAGVSAATPVASVGYTYPVSEIAYILLAPAAYLDTTGRYKYTTDVFSVTDAASLNTSKTADADAFALTDITAVDAIKGLLDVTSLSDSVITVLIFIRDFADTISPVDSKTLFISPAYSDTISTSDTEIRSFSKTLADSFVVNDLTDATGPIISFDDFTNNVVIASDSSIMANDKGVLDSFSLSDTGTVTSQNYCDITYFLTGYVGESRTF